MPTVLAKIISQRFIPCSSHHLCSLLSDTSNHLPNSSYLMSSKMQKVVGALPFDKPYDHGALNSLVPFNFQNANLDNPSWTDPLPDKKPALVSYYDSYGSHYSITVLRIHPTTLRIPPVLMRLLPQRSNTLQGLVPLQYSQPSSPNGLQHSS
jgi:hypothetical protein